jgi:hypothetical protein
MPDIQIDVTGDEDDDVSVENAELDWIRIAVAGVTLEEAQAELKRIKRGAKAAGMTTRARAFSAG